MTNALLLRRRGMIQAQQGGLPYDAEIEYLAANNPYEQINLEDSAYIDTQVLADGWTSFEIKWRMNDTNVQRRVCGNYGSIVYIIYTTGGKYIGTSFSDNSNDAKTTSVLLGTNKIHIVKMDAASLETYVDGALKITRTIRPVNTPNSNFNLFAATSGQYQMYGRIYYCKLWRTTNGVDTMLRDFIPVRVGQVGYMYDRVSGQLFGNQGTGNFVLGPDKN